MIQRIRFYTTQWSHYCDKPFGKTKGLEQAPKITPKLMPMIEDPNNKDDNQFHYDSTPILLYLDTQYPQSSLSLFPSSNKERQQVIDTCLRLDSTLGLYGHRIAYVQILTESPNVLSLVLREKYPWANNPDDIRSR
ncbi:unnamed protein product [Rotaria sordida]|uniref:GST N-terminal domain-containing protein n=1 Tax=Rotaria sordida TaxID=392033 RepID=A0A814YKF4_9BILA|nr:unnamed protein product [Rotaria sordida]CAF1230259.1 unnamed protein product [Rotaria sordida]